MYIMLFLLCTLILNGTILIIWWRYKENYIHKVRRQNMIRLNRIVSRDDIEVIKRVISENINTRGRLETFFVN